MALQGTLKDFSIADIFQLIGQQGKSGSLLIATKEREAHVIFDNGSVLLARFSKSTDDYYKLGNFLLRAEAISEAQLTEALQEHKRLLKSLGDILVSKRFITEETLGEFLGIQTREVLFDLLHWTAGAYRFKVEKFNYSKRTVKPISTDFLLMDGFRQVDEWPALREEISSFEQVFDVTAAGRQALAESSGGSGANDVDDIDAAFAEFDSQKAKPNGEKSAYASLDESEKQVIELVNGQRTMQQIIDLSRLGQFEAVRSIVSLLQAKLVQRVSGQFQSNRAKANHTTFNPNKVSSLTNIIASYVVVIITVSALILFSRPDILKSEIGSMSVHGIEADLVTSLSTFNIMHRIKNAADVYHLENLRYPNNIEELQEKRLISERDVQMFNKLGFYYATSLDHYLLLLPPH